MDTVVYGIDPGLVDTGIVRLQFQPGAKRVHVTSTVMTKATAESISKVLIKSESAHVFIEGYRPRSHFNTDDKMVNLVAQIHKEIPRSKVLLNHGVKKVIRRQLMVLLGCWNFNRPTHHQDLRSAAYIALFGMVKDDELNRVLTQFTHDHVRGRTWDVLV